MLNPGWAPPPPPYHPPEAVAAPRLPSEALPLSNRNTTPHKNYVKLHTCYTHGTPQSSHKPTCSCCSSSFARRSSPSPAAAAISSSWMRSDSSPFCLRPESNCGCVYVFVCVSSLVFVWGGRRGVRDRQQEQERKQQLKSATHAGKLRCKACVLLCAQLNVTLSLTLSPTLPLSHFPPTCMSIAAFCASAAAVCAISPPTSRSNATSSVY